MSHDDSAAWRMKLRHVLNYTQAASQISHPCLTPPLGGFHQNFWMKLVPRKLQGWGYCTVKTA